jgi:hypothetical protein
MAFHGREKNAIFTGREEEKIFSDQYIDPCKEVLPAAV